MRFVAAFSRHPVLLDWLWERVRATWGPTMEVSIPFPFSESAYYQSSMGQNLLKQFAVLDLDYDPTDLADNKILTNEWEAEAKRSFDFSEDRPLNIDPGYMSLTKIVLASTKNREHRIYLQNGIYAEVTLAYREQQWKPMEWTYPDYQRADFREFFSHARKCLFRPYSGATASENER